MEEKQKYILKRSEYFYISPRSVDFEIRRMDNINLFKEKVLKSNNAFWEKSYFNDEEIPLPNDHIIVTTSKPFLTYCLKKSQKVIWLGVEDGDDKLKNFVVNFKGDKENTYIASRKDTNSDFKKIDINNENHQFEIGEEVCVLRRRIPANLKEEPFISLGHYKVVNNNKKMNSFFLFGLQIYDDMNMENWISPYSKLVIDFRKSIEKNCLSPINSLLNKIKANSQYNYAEI